METYHLIRTERDYVTYGYNLLYSTFSRIELPELMQNVNVKNITYINIE